MKKPRAGTQRFVFGVAVLSALALAQPAHAEEIAAAPASSNLAMLPASSAAAPAVVSATAQAAAAKQEGRALGHIGVDGTFAVGLANFIGGSMRFEARPHEATSFLGRVGLMGGALFDKQSFQAVSAGVGFRGYLGRGYLGVEGSILLYNEEGEDATGIPNLTTALGAKLGSVDASVQIMYPLASLGVSVGADFEIF